MGPTSTEIREGPEGPSGWAKPGTRSTYRLRISEDGPWQRLVLPMLHKASSRPENASKLYKVVFEIRLHIYTLDVNPVSFWTDFQSILDQFGVAPRPQNPFKLYKGFSKSDLAYRPQVPFWNRS